MPSTLRLLTGKHKVAGMNTKTVLGGIPLEVGPVQFDVEMHRSGAFEAVLSTWHIFAFPHSLGPAPRKPMG